MSLSSLADYRHVPILVLCRDRLTCLRDLIAWLEGAGHELIYLIDNASTYPPLLDLYESTPHQVIRLQNNLGKRKPDRGQSLAALWQESIIDEIVGSKAYVITDPDILPLPDTPQDAVGHFLDLLQRYPDVDKCGFGLYLDDLPEHYPLRDVAKLWESQFWIHEREPGVFRASIDTTFALYRGGYRHRAALPYSCLRTGFPYVARHTAWYLDPRSLPPDEAYYASHAHSATTHWSVHDSPLPQEWLAAVGVAVVETLRKRVEAHATQVWELQTELAALRMAKQEKRSVWSTRRLIRAILPGRWRATP